MAPWREINLLTILTYYNSCNIYNADDFGLLCRALPTKSMYLSSEKCRGGKNSKVRFTGFAAAKMCGEKIPMFVIRKPKKLCCFKGIRHTPCSYRELFEKWVKEHDRKFALEVRKVAMVIDNCTTYSNIENLKSITLYFLPPYTTSCLQPMDQGVIRS